MAKTRICESLTNCVSVLNDVNEGVSVRVPEHMRIGSDPNNSNMLAKLFDKGGHPFIASSWDGFR